MVVTMVVTMVVPTYGNHGSVWFYIMREQLTECMKGLSENGWEKKIEERRKKFINICRIEVSETKTVCKVGPV